MRRWYIALGSITVLAIGLAVALSLVVHLGTAPQRGVQSITYPLRMVNVSGVLLATGGAANASGPGPVSGGVVKFRSESVPAAPDVITTTTGSGTFDVTLVPGLYMVEAFASATPNALRGSYGPFRIGPAGHRPLRLTLVAI